MTIISNPNLSVIDKYIADNGGTRKNAITMCLLDHMAYSIGYYNPTDAENYLLDEIIVIEKEYRGNNIMTNLMRESAKNGLEKGMKHGMALCTAKASYLACTRVSKK